MRPNPPEVDRAAASKAAVAARRARAAVKQDILTGARTPLAVLRASIDPAAKPEHTLRVTEYLTSIPNIGPTKLERILADLGISPAKRLGGLGVHQREHLEDFIVRWQTAKSIIEPSRLVVLAGPTAVGKGTVSTHIRENYPDVMLSVSATTRAPRPGEIEGVNYYFVDDEGFDRLIADGALLEWATVHNAYRYGTPRAPIEAALAQGKSVLLEIDIQGARQVRQAMPEARLVFLLPPSWDELVRRLIGRGTESSEEQSRRLVTAKQELAAQDEFDYAVVNRDVPDAAREVVDLMQIRSVSPASTAR
ncbi:guanylate kinase [Planctomonas psychrotolerans]|uniref:guanylate kinase n=1 Tax=Planctomonas psychrotolerans TaxID=2528712 RepID=UPI00123A561B|nr:guanylate kinase [Planctomonas psychrotolerans]